MHETHRSNTDDRYIDDVASLKTILGALDIGHLIKRVHRVNRLGEYKPGRRRSRVVKISFDNEHIARILIDKSPRLANHHLLGNMFIKEDESFEERQRKWTVRRRGEIVETGHRDIHRTDPQTQGGIMQLSDEPGNGEFIITDEVNESSDESGNTEGDTHVTVEATSERNEALFSQDEFQRMRDATIKASIEIMGIREGTGNWVKIGHESVDTRIGRLRGVTSSIVAERNAQSGNRRSRENTTGD